MVHPCGWCQIPHDKLCLLQLDSVPPTTTSEPQIDLKHSIVSFFPLSYPKLNGETDTSADTNVSPDDQVFLGLCTQILQILTQHAQNQTPTQKQAIAQTLLPFVKLGDPIPFVLPAFPFKTPVFDNVTGIFADKAEHVCLENLRDLCLRINRIYPPGCHVTIANDGLAFNDLLDVEKASINNYLDSLRQILHTISGAQDVIKMWNISQQEGNSQILASAKQQHTAHLDAVVQQVKANRKMYNTFTAFLACTVKFYCELSHTEEAGLIHPKAARLALGLMSRSNLIHQLITSAFPNHIHLTLHDVDFRSPSADCGFSIPIPVCLIPPPRNSSTISPQLAPWHNVLVESTDSGYRYSLMSKGRVTHAAPIDKMGCEVNLNDAWGFQMKPEPPVVSLLLHVQNPVVSNEKTPYTIYSFEIVDRANDMVIKISHRYSEFEHLKEALLTSGSDKDRESLKSILETTKFPPKTIIRAHGTSTSVQDKRANDLGAWILAVLSDPILKRSPLVEEFVSATSTCDSSREPNDGE